MHEHDEGGQAPAQRILIILSISLSLLMLLLVAGFIYNVIFGFGGAFTVRYVPVPDNLVRDIIGAAGGDFSAAKRGRIYEVQQTVDELVAFYQQELPRTGWTILDQGDDPPGYCLIAEQRGVRADIWMVEIPENAVTRVFIHIDEPRAPCKFELRD